MSTTVTKLLGYLRWPLVVAFVASMALCAYLGLSGNDELAGWQWTWTAGVFGVAAGICALSKADGQAGAR